MNKKPFLWISWLLIMAFVVSNTAWTTSVNAAPDPTSASLPIFQTSEGDDYLILLSTENIRPEEVNPLARPISQDDILAEIVSSRAGPILSELEILKAEGWIASYEVQPQLFGIIVRGLTQEGLQHLQTLAGIGGILRNDASSQTCAVSTAEAFTQQAEVMGESLRRRELFKMNGGANITSESVLATNPSIEVSYYSGGYGWIEGQTDPNKTVQMRILRSGNPVATDSTTSDSDGWFYFYPEWNRCPDGGYSWSLFPGDVVELTVDGRTVRTTVANLTAWADPQSNQVSGKTDPGRSVKVSLFYFPSSPCDQTEVVTNGSTDTSGNFAINMGVDFDGRSYGFVYALDSNGNATVKFIRAFALHVWSDVVSGFIKPNTAYTAVLKRGNQILETFEGTSDPENGYFYERFSEDFQENDRIEVQGGGANLAFSVVRLDNLNIDPDANRVSGVTSGSRRIVVNASGGFYYYYQIRQRCGYFHTCASVPSSSDGSFNVPINDDLMRGDSIYIYILDDQGNYQYSSFVIPRIGVEVSSGYDRVIGMWYWNSQLTITHKNSAAVTKNTYSYSLSPYSDYFSVGLSNVLEPGDRIQVSDGSTTLEMTVPNPLPTASLKSNQNKLFGSGPSGSRVVAAINHRDDDGFWMEFCRETTIADSSFAVAVDGIQIKGKDSADVWINLPGDHFIYLYRPAFRVYHWLGDNWLGVVYEPGMNIRVKRWRGSTLLDVQQFVKNGIYDFASMSDEIRAGDRLEITTDDGHTADLTVPDLTINLDRPNNRIYGKSVPNQPVWVSLQRFTKWGYNSLSNRVQTNSSGEYSATFSNQYWYDCSPASLSHRCASGRVEYLTTDRHSFYRFAPAPEPAAADAYEEDDVRESAKPYTSFQTHTFHEYPDDDWVYFDVPDADVNLVPYRIATFNKGIDLSVRIALYNSAGDLIRDDYDWNWNWNNDNWLPSAAGRYYVRVYPESSADTAYCDAYYDLMILPVRAQVYLPLIRR